MIVSKVLTGLVALASGSALVAGCASQPLARYATAGVVQTDAAESTDSAKQLASEEREACYQVPEADRVNGPFTSDCVLGVEVVRDHGVFPKGALVPVGVSVYLRAEPGLTQEWLGRIVACNMAHMAATGPSSHPSPLAVRGSDVTVYSTGTGFRVTVTSKNSDVARSIVEQGQGLGGPTAG